MAAKRNTDARRAQIVEGLLSVMVTSGYDGASVVSIARAADLASGLVHYHFRSKDEILLALVERLVGTVRARYEARSAGMSDAHARLDALIDAYVAHGPDADPRAVVAWALVGAEAVRQPAVRAAYQRAIEQTLELFRTHVRACLSARGRVTAPARRIAATLVSTVEGALRIGAVTEGVLPLGFAAAMIKKLADRLVDAEPHS